MAFQQKTRRRILKLPEGNRLNRPAGTGGGQTACPLPRAGYLAAILLSIRGSIAGTLSALHPLGKAGILRRIKFVSGTGFEVHDLSGPGYHYLVRPKLGLSVVDPLAYSDAYAAVATGAFTLDVILPVSVNQREPVGLAALQSKQSSAQVILDWESDAAVATGITSLTGTVEVAVEMFDAPNEQEEQPDTSLMHALQEYNIVVTTTDEILDDWQTGGAMGGMYYLFPSGFTNIKAGVMVTDMIEDLSANLHQLNNAHISAFNPTLSGALSGTDKRAWIDWLGSDGFGAFGVEVNRDLLNTRGLTSAFARLTPAAAQTIRAVRRWLLPVGAPAQP